MNEKRKIILIVEDEAPIRKALVDKLNDEGYKTLEAVNGVEALETALREHPDFILLDILLPRMDGITMLKKLREDSYGRDVPVLVLTNLSDGEKVAESMENGVYGYLVKHDWSLEEVAQQIKDKLEKEK